MPIQGIVWTGTSEQDIHLLRGQSTGDLWGDRLFFTEPARSVSAQRYFQDHQPSDVTLIFQPLFKGARTPAQNLPPEQPPHDIFSGQGIAVDMLTGRVTVDALPRPLPKNNFIMEVTATNTGPGAGPPMTERIRVHIHTSIETSADSLALTPATLTVRPTSATRTDPEPTGYRFTLRALFDDGVMGDLTEHHGVAWSPADHVDSDGELVIAPGDVADGPPITITATLPAELGGRSATGTLQIAPSWRDDPALPHASIVVGGGWPGTTLPDTAPNVMFLGDGFESTDSTSFGDIATTMVQHLKTDRLLRPFDVLCTSMNFWRAFVPATARGISFRGEVYTFEHNGTALAAPVPAPERPLASGDYKLGHLVYAVGLPVPNDANKSVSDLRSDWDALVGPQPLPHGRIKDDVVNQWKQLATRGFIEELDNFPGMAAGSPPAANSFPGTPLLRLHPFRGGRNGLNQLFAPMQSDSNVQVGPGARIGALWAGRPPRRNDTAYRVGDVVTVFTNPERLFVCITAGTTEAAEPADYTTAADAATVADGTATFRAMRLAFNSNPLLVVVSSYPAGRPVNYGNHIAVSTRSGNYAIPVGLRAMGFVLHFEADDVPVDVEVDSCRTIAHELGHSFGLGDEYIEFDRDFPDTQASLAPYLNLQAEADLQLNGQLDPRRIRWNWHRIRKAAVIRDAITSAGTGGFKIPVVPGQAWQFRKDDTVLLRRRVLGQFLGAAYDVNPNVSPALQIAVAPSASASNDFLLVQPAAGANVTLAELQAFTPGSILFLPVPAPSSVRTAAYPYAEMVAKNVRDLIGRRHEALFRQPTGSDLQDELQDPRARQQPKIDGLAPQLPGVFCFSEKHKIAGLYEGGRLSARHIFHPTGSCMMRMSHLDTAEFCAVCRYAMVEYIDPFHHFQIDRDHDDIYPLS